jgi:diaminopimelate epimerase
MTIPFEKYHGTGNDFILIDNRNLQFDANDHDLIRKMCSRRFGIGADGLMLLQNHDDVDFEMVYFNADGHESSMCGNGGRCITAFAAKLGIIKEQAKFLAIDGAHESIIEPNGKVHLKMNDVKYFEIIGRDYFMDTGSPHYMTFKSIAIDGDLIKKAHAIRYNTRFEEEGVNVNFIEILDEGKIRVRTYERGVEDETLSCGTGLVAAAIAVFLKESEGTDQYKIETKGGQLSVRFKPIDRQFEDIWLSGDAQFVFSGVYVA